MKISLVLGSGGARGYAHIGVLQEIEARGHEVVAISGSSMGALVGGAYAAGRLSDATNLALSLTRLDLWRMLRPGLGGPGFITGDRLMSLLRRVIGDVRIEELPIPYTAVATDLLSRREIWFHEGPLLAAIRASIAIPTVFTPVMLKGRLLADGGLLNPLPVETSLRLDADLTLAVSLFAKRPGQWSGGAIELSSDAQPEPGPLTRLGERIVEALPTRQKLPDDDPNDVFDPLPNNLDLTDMMTMALDVMQARIQATRISVNPPDVHIEVPAELGTILDFDEASRIIAVGRELAQEKFDEFGM
ncbi:MAG: patatin-like phospholipase family protein [Brooklawnia sp.]|uniref:patatin-like phospholipase family protein n=1 Tax=Brooklawnia sp. TaxID=2699740 RepID=UPI003C782C74